MSRNLKEKVRKDIESLLIPSPLFYDSCKGYLLVEINGVLRCYHIRSNLLTFEFNDQPLENIQVSAEIDDLIDKECDLKTITQSVAYSNTLKKYNSLVNKINNKRKELANLEKEVKEKKKFLEDKNLVVFPAYFVRQLKETHINTKNELNKNRKLYNDTPDALCYGLKAKLTSFDEME